MENNKNTMNNSAHPKTMEHLRKRINVRLVNNAKDYFRYVSKPTFISQKIFSKNFADIYKTKPVLVPIIRKEVSAAPF